MTHQPEVSTIFLSDILRRFETRLVNSVRIMIRELEIELLSGDRPSSTVSTSEIENISLEEISGHSGSPSSSNHGLLKYAGSTPFPQRWSTPNNNGFVIPPSVFDSGNSMRSEVLEDSNNEANSSDELESVIKSWNREESETESFHLEDAVTDTPDISEDDDLSCLKLEPEDLGDIGSNHFDVSESTDSIGFRPSLSGSFKRKLAVGVDGSIDLETSHESKRYKSSSSSSTDITPKFSPPATISGRRISFFRSFSVSEEENEEEVSKIDTRYNYETNITTSMVSTYGTNYSSVSYNADNSSNETSMT